MIILQKTQLKDIKKKFICKLFNLAFRHIEYFIRFDGFVSFNLFYYAEKYFEEVCKNLDKKFIILHKESAFTRRRKKAPKFIENLTINHYHIKFRFILKVKKNFD